MDAVHVVSGSEVGQGIYTIVSANNKLDLEVNGASKANGGVINHYHGSGSANTYEHWYLVPIGDGFYRIVNVNS